MKHMPVNSGDIERPKKCFEQIMAAVQMAKEKAMNGCAFDET